MVLGLICALGAALGYGVGSVLQAMAARQEPLAVGLDPGLLLRLLRSWRYVVGLGLDLLGFLLTLVAVQSLPLFVVQSVVASFLAVTAVLGAVLLRMPLTRRDWIGLGVTVVGLTLVGLSGANEKPVTISLAEQWWVLAAAAALGVLALPLGRWTGTRGAAALGAVAGLAFGATSVAARMLPDSLSLAHPLSSLGILLRSPSAYALVVAGAVALLAYSTALQRGSVTAATAPLVVGETVAPALVGLLVLGDRPREGWEVVAAIGFALAVAGAISLARYGEVMDETHPLEGARPA
jgi:drug/metabolite transporter (DMT)-like permease